MIAVVIPAHDSARFLPQTIASVRDQGDVPLQVVVVDDGSEDGTAEVAESLGADIRVVRQANQGPATARNVGVAATDAELIAFLDADDLWPAGRMATLAARFEADPDLRLAIGRTQLILERPSGDEVALETSGPPWHAPVFGSTLIHREAFTTVGPIDAGLEPAEDMDWFIRARERKLPTAVLRDTTLLYRLHGANLTSGADPIRRNMLLALKRSLDRRRHGTDEGPARLTSWLPTSDELEIE